MACVFALVLGLITERCLILQNIAYVHILHNETCVRRRDVRESQRDPV